MSNSSSAAFPRQVPYRLILDLTERLELEGHVSPLGAKLLKAILRFDDKGAPCFVRNQTFADTYRVARKTVANQLSLLVSGGLVVRTVQNGRRVLYVNTCAMKSWAFKTEGCSHVVGTSKKDFSSEKLSGITSDHFSHKRSQVSEESQPDRKQSYTSRPKSGLTPVRCQPEPAGAAAAPHTKGKGETAVEGFFAPTQPKPGPKKPDVTADDQRRAEQLRGAVRDHTKAPPESLAKTDAAEMGVLRRKIKDDVRLDAVLAWYCRHISEKWTPKAVTGASFRAKFHSIEAAMSRASVQSPPPSKELGPSAPDPEADALVDKIIHTATWPRGSASQVASLARRALADVRAFQRVLNNLVRNGDASPLTVDHAAAARSLLKVMGPPDFVVEQWFTAVLERVSRWEQWSGKLDYFTWRFDHPDAVGAIRDGLGWAGAMYEEHWADLISCVRGWV